MSQRYSKYPRSDYDIMTWLGESVPNSIIALVQSFDNFFTQKIIPDGHAYSVIEIWKYIAVNKQDISQEC